MWLSVEAPGVRAPWGFLCVWLFPVAHRCRIPCRRLLVCVVLLAIVLVEGMVRKWLALRACGALAATVW